MPLAAMLGIAIAFAVAVAIAAAMLLVVRAKSRAHGLAPKRSALGRLQRDPTRSQWPPGTVTDPAREIVVRSRAIGPASVRNVARVQGRGAARGLAAAAEGAVLRQIPGYGAVQSAEEFADQFRRGPGVARRQPTYEEQVAMREEGQAAAAAGGYDAVSRETGSSYIFDPIGLRLRWVGGANWRIRWDELSHVSLQVVTSIVGVMTRIVMYPADAARFTAEHPELEMLRSKELPGAYTASFGVDQQQVGQGNLAAIQAGLRYAGNRWNGQVEQVVTDRMRAAGNNPLGTAAYLPTDYAQRQGYGTAPHTPYSPPQKAYPPPAPPYPQQGYPPPPQPHPRQGYPPPPQ